MGLHILLYLEKAAIKSSSLITYYRGLSGRPFPFPEVLLRYGPRQGWVRGDAGLSGYSQVGTVQSGGTRIPGLSFLTSVCKLYHFDCDLAVQTNWSLCRVPASVVREG